MSPDLGLCGSIGSSTSLLDVFFRLLSNLLRSLCLFLCTAFLLTSLSIIVFIPRGGGLDWRWAAGLGMMLQHTVINRQFVMSLCIKKINSKILQK